MTFFFRWWKEYADRKADEEDEHVADSLLYDRNHLPRAAPPPESVFEERAKLAAIASQMPFTAVTVKNGDSDHIKPASWNLSLHWQNVDFLHLYYYIDYTLALVSSGMACVIAGSQIFAT